MQDRTTAGNFLTGSNVETFSRAMSAALLDLQEMFNLALSAADTRNQAMHAAMVTEAFVRLGDSLSVMSQAATGRPMDGMVRELEPLQKMAEDLARRAS